MDGLGPVAQSPAFTRADAADFGYDFGFRALQSLLSDRPKIDSVFCTNDIVAIGVLDAAKRCGRRVPEEMWVVGYDDIPMSRWECIGLTTAAEVPKVVKEIQQLMQEYNLSNEDIAGKPSVKPAARAVPSKTKAAPPPRYRNPKTGQTWSGGGRAPAWIGKKPERFLIDLLY